MYNDINFCTSLDFMWHLVLVITYETNWEIVVDVEPAWRALKGTRTSSLPELRTSGSSAENIPLGIILPCTKCLYYDNMVLDLLTAPCKQT